MEYKDLFNENKNFPWENIKEKKFFNEFFSVLIQLENFDQRTDFISHHIILQNNKRLFVEKVKAKFMHLQRKGHFEETDELGGYLVHMLTVYPTGRSELPLEYPEIGMTLNDTFNVSITPNDPFIKAKEVAQLLKCSVRHVRDLYGEYKILKFRKVGRSVLIERESVVEYLEVNRR